MKRKNARQDWGGIGCFLSLYFLVPVLLSKVVLGASWRGVGIAYAIWFALLFLWGQSNRGTPGEKIGWPIIMGIFLTTPAIPVIVLLLRVLADLR